MKFRAQPASERVIDEELEHHILERIDALIEQGYPPAAARREAERRFGDTKAVRRALQSIRAATARELRWSDYVRAFFRDLRHGVRLLRKEPGVAVAVILTIGVGVGANAALFSVTDAVLMRPLPYEERDRLVSLDAFYVDQDWKINRWTAERGNAVAEGLSDHAAVVRFAQRSFVRGDVTEPHRVMGFGVSGDWLTALGATPALGRGFGAADGADEAPLVVVLGHELWQQRFGGDLDILGKSVQLDQNQFEVVGVMPAGFKFPPISSSEAWVPLRADGTVDGNRAEPFVSLVANIGGASSDAIFERANAVALGVSEEIGSGSVEVRGEPLDSFRANRDVRRALLVLSGVGIGMLMIAIINAANLMLVRADTRRSEMELRLALGASRARLVRQACAEFLVWAGAGALLAIGIAYLAVDLLASQLPAEVTWFLTSQVVVDHRVLGFALATMMLVALGAGVLPSLRATRSLVSTGRTTAGSPTSRLRHGLLIAQVAITVALLSGAALMMQSFVRLTAVDPGFNTAGLTQFSMELPVDSYPEPEAQRAFFDELKERLQAQPGVVRVSLANGVPPRSGFSFGVSPEAEGGAPKELPGVFLPNATVGTDYFAALQTPVVEGRSFLPQDAAEPDKVIIDRSLAQFLWGVESGVVGRRFRLNEGEPWLTVVGLIDDLKLMGQDDRDGEFELFYPLQADAQLRYMSMLVRSEGAPGAAVASIRAEVRSLDPTLPIDDLTTLTSAMADANDKPRFYLRAMGLFAVLAVTLAVIGTYGTLAFMVRTRYRELGVRAALGAQTGALRWMVLRRGLALTTTGIALGLFGGYAVGRGAGSLLYGVEPLEPIASAAAVACMLLCAAAASWFPAVQATRADPNDVLRAD